MEYLPRQISCAYGLLRARVRPSSDMEPDRARQVLERVRKRAGFSGWCLRRLGFAVSGEGFWYRRRLPDGGTTTRLFCWPWRRRTRRP